MWAACAQVPLRCILASTPGVSERFGTVSSMAEELNIEDGAGPRALARAVPPRDASAADRVRASEFPTAMRGYDREAVDGFVAQVADLVDTLESRQTRETVVQRALEEVGEQTSAILKQAHESADDITARSRSQAEDRVEVAREEAATMLQEASQEAAELKAEIEDLQEERANLIDELRRFAAETSSVADAAAERLDPSLPEAVVQAPAEEPVELPYDGSADDDPEEDWTVEEPVEPTEQPTDELAIAPGDRREDEPPRGGA